MTAPLLTVAADSFQWRLQPDFARLLGADGPRLQDKAGSAYPFSSTRYNCL